MSREFLTASKEATGMFHRGFNDFQEVSGGLWRVSSGFKENSEGF